MPVPMPRFPAIPSPILPSSGGRRAGVMVGEEGERAGVVGRRVWRRDGQVNGRGGG